MEISFDVLTVHKKLGLFFAPTLSDNCSRYIYTHYDTKNLNLSPELLI